MKTKSLKKILTVLTLLIGLSYLQAGAVTVQLSQGQIDKITNAINSRSGQDQISYMNRVISNINNAEARLSTLYISEPRLNRLTSLLEQIRQIFVSRLGTGATVGTGTTSSGTLGTSGSGTSSTGTYTGNPQIGSLMLSLQGNTTATFSFTSNMMGSGFFVVTPLGGYSTIPTMAQVMAGFNQAGNTALSSGNFPIVQGNNTFTVTGLSPNTTYTMYFGARDYLNNNIANVMYVNFSTSSGSSTSTSSGLSIQLLPGTVTSRGGLFSVTSNGTGTGYFLVLPSGSAAPTASQIIAGQGANGTSGAFSGSLGLISGSNNSFNISGLSPLTSYTLYLVPQDQSGTLQQVLSIPLTTTSTSSDTTAPIVGISVNSTLNNRATLTISSNEAGIGYWELLPQGSQAPSVSQLRSGIMGNGSAAALRGTIPLMSGTNGLNIDGLTNQTGYTFYFIAEDMNGNVSQSVMSQFFNTLP